MDKNNKRGRKNHNKNGKIKYTCSREKHQSDVEVDVDLTFNDCAAPDSTDCDCSGCCDCFFSICCGFLESCIYCCFDR